MTKKLKKRLYRIIAGAVCYAACMALEKLVPVSNNVLLIAFLVTYFIIGGDVLKGAAQNIIKGQIFDEKFLMVIATIGAFLSSQYPEAVAVMLFYQIGEWFQSYAVNKSRRSIKDLMDIRPDYANVYNEAGELVSVDPDEVSIGTTIVVKPGEKILRLNYIKKNTSEALISETSRKFSINLNIIFADLEIVQDAPIGGTVAIASGRKEDIEGAVEYLKAKNVGVEVIENG